MNQKRSPEQPCPSGVYWIVEKGDTLFMISRKMDVDLAELIAANPGINPPNLQIGSKICIPK